MNGAQFWITLLGIAGLAISTYYLGYQNGRERSREFYRWIAEADK